MDHITPYAVVKGDVLLADGWERIGRAECVKWMHVDEIEKVEGPPPEGPF